MICKSEKEDRKIITNAKKAAGENGIGINFVTIQLLFRTALRQIGEKAFYPQISQMDADFKTRIQVLFLSAKSA